MYQLQSLTIRVLPMLCALLVGCKPSVDTGVTALKAVAQPARVLVNGQTNLRATVFGFGDFDRRVHWEIVSGGGRLSSTEGPTVTFTALTEGTTRVRAVSPSDARRRDEVAITVDPLTSITGLDASALPDRVVPGGNSLLSGRVVGTGNFDARLRWQILSGTGTLSSDQGSSVTFNAPTNVGLTIVRVSSVATTNVFRDLTIRTATDPSAPTITGITLSAEPDEVTPNGESRLTAVVSGTGMFNPEVRWEIIRGGGQLSTATGSEVYFQAPGVVGATFVRAIAVGNPSISRDVQLRIAFDPRDVHPQVELVAYSLPRMSEMQFAPNGELFLAMQMGGFLKAFNLTTLAAPHHDGWLPQFRPGTKAGLLGMALDPDFASNHWVYLCYSYWKDGVQQPTTQRNRLSRFELSPGQFGGEQILLDDLPGSDERNGCRVIISGGKLFVSTSDIADQGVNDPMLSQDWNSPAGKIMRINLDGSIPSDNPFPGNPAWSRGHSNARGLAMDSVTNLLWDGEEHPGLDEVNVVRSTGNGGWPLCLGLACAVPNQWPLRTYQPSQGIGDMSFYEGHAFPAWQGDLFFIMQKTGKLMRIEPMGDSSRDHVVFTVDHGELTAMTVGPDGFIYLAVDDGPSSRILRLRP